MPKVESIIKYNHREKSMKPQFIIMLTWSLYLKK